MPDIIVILHADRLIIDGELPEGYRLIVHNHTGEPDLYPYECEIDSCQYPDSAGDEGGRGVQCFEYTEPHNSSHDA